MQPRGRFPRGFWVAMTLFFSCSAQAAPVTVVVGRTGSFGQLDPAQPTDLLTLEVARQMFDTLVRFKDDSVSLEPGLAERWSISPDMTRYVFRLRQGVRFHDGSPVDADAVIYSLMRQHSPSHPAHKSFPEWPYYSSMGMGELIRDIRKLGPYEVEIVLKRPEAPLLANLAMNFASIVNPKSPRKSVSGRPLPPLGSGPFKFVSAGESRVELAANPDYWRRRPGIDRLVYRAFAKEGDIVAALEKGELDITATTRPAMLEQLSKGGFRVHEFQPLSVCFLTMNLGVPPFGRREVREAVRMALDRQVIAQAGFGRFGVVARNPIPPSLWSHDERTPLPERDVARARSLLAASGVTLPLRVTLLVRERNESHVAIAEAVRRQLGEAGIEIEIKKAARDYYDLVGEHKFTMTINDWYGDNGDPDNFLGVLFGADSILPRRSTNISGYRSDVFTGLLRKAKAVPLQEERELYYRQAQKLFFEDAVAVPLAHLSAAFIARDDIEGLKVNPLYYVEFSGVSRRR